MEKSINRVGGAVQGITKEIDFALMGDALSDKAAARIEARWHAGVEDAIEDVDLNWHGKLVQMLFNKLRNMCL